MLPASRALSKALTFAAAPDWVLAETCRRSGLPEGSKPMETQPCHLPSARRMIVLRPLAARFPTPAFLADLSVTVLLQELFQRLYRHKPAPTDPDRAHSPRAEEREHG